MDYKVVVTKNAGYYTGYFDKEDVRFTFLEKYNDGDYGKFINMNSDIIFLIPVIGG